MRRGAHRLAAHLGHHDLRAHVVEHPLERDEVPHGPLDAPLLLWRALWMRAPRIAVASRSA